MATTPTILKKLMVQLYPTGKAMRVPVNGYKEGLHKALALSEAQALSSGRMVLNSILPDSDLFTDEDATDWERRLGLISNPDVDLADRKLAIRRKMNHPGTIKARQHKLYIQGQLQAAGFDVYVHENIPAIIPIYFLIDQSYGQMGDGQMGDFQMGTFFTVHSDLVVFIQMGDAQMGDAQMGGYYWKNKIVNHITWQKDLFFQVGSYRNIFFIGGETPGTFADVAPEREAEFRQLVLKIKPAQTVAYLLINF